MIPITFETPEIKALPLDKVVTYLLNAGWQQIPHPNPNLKLFRGARNDAGQPIELILPENSNLWDSSIILAKAVNLLAAVEDRSPMAIIADIQLSSTEKLDKILIGDRCGEVL